MRNSRTMNSNDIADSEEPKPIIYSCSGCSDAGELADLVARKLTRDGAGEMSCLAGIGGRLKHLMRKGQKARWIVVIDVCPLTCAKHTLLLAGLTQFEHVKLHELGHRKGSCPVREQRVEEATEAVVGMIKKKEGVPDCCAV